MLQIAEARSSATVYVFDVMPVSNYYRDAALQEILNPMVVETGRLIAELSVTVRIFADASRI